MAENTIPPYAIANPKVISRATRTRRIFAFLTSFLFLVSLIFLILVEIGTLNAHHPVLSSIYFIRLDLSHIIPRSVPNSQLINSIARTLGLHDFYQVGLWNFCEGNGNQITYCSKPRKMYWFNPVQIIVSELLAGATSTTIFSHPVCIMTLLIFFFSCSPFQYHRRPHICPHSLPLDVRPLPDRRLSYRPFHSPYTTFNLHTLGLAPAYNPYLSNRPNYNGSNYYRICYVYHLQEGYP